MSATTLVTVNNTLLESLYGSFATQSYTTGSTTSNVVGFINYLTATDGLSPSQQNTAYNNMANAISAWLANPATLTAVGLPAGTPTTTIDGLRVQVIFPDGSVIYDSNSANNALANINIPRSDFITSGKYLIGENHGGRPYYIGAALSNNGTAIQKAYSTATSTYQYYYAVRQGATAVQFGSIVVISANTSAN
jgi:hypothetical protein